MCLTPIGLMIIIVLFANTLTFGAKKTGPELRKVSYMKCHQLNQEEFEYALSTFDEKFKYKLTKEGPVTVQFQFNLDFTEMGEAKFALKSRKAYRLGGNDLLYVGPYSSSLNIHVDAGLASGRYFDNIEFRLLQIREKRLCRFSNSEDYPYWTHGARIKIDFLYERTIDENELVKMFEIEIR